jgi:hypothetical protein
MADITATVLSNPNINASIDVPSIPTVPSVGIRGQRGPQGIPGGQVPLGNLDDVDASGKENGSVLVYKTITSKWTATRNLDLQIMEGGEF